MYFHNIHDFLMMGGFAAYVWSAFGISLLVLIINIYLPMRTRRQLLKQLVQQNGEAR